MNGLDELERRFLNDLDSFVRDIKDAYMSGPEQGTKLAEVVADKARLSALVKVAKAAEKVAGHYPADADLHAALARLDTALDNLNKALEEEG